MKGFFYHEKKQPVPPDARIKIAARAGVTAYESMVTEFV
jgi:hypothetical protein